MLALPILFHVLVAGTAIGLVAARRLGWKMLVYARSESSVRSLALC